MRGLRIEPTRKKRSFLPRGLWQTANRYGRETVVESPDDEILKVPDAVEAAYPYGELQPAGGGGTFAMNGPAVWPWVFVATTVRSVRAVGSTPMWAA